MTSSTTTGKMSCLVVPGLNSIVRVGVAYDSDKMGGWPGRRTSESPSQILVLWHRRL